MSKSPKQKATADQASNTWSPRESQKQTILFALVAWIATILVATCYPLDHPVDEISNLSPAATYGWVAAQAFLPIGPVCLVALLIAQKTPRLGFNLGTIGLSCIPALILADCITFHWIGERFLSKPTYHIFATMIPNLIPFLSWGTVIAGIAAIAGILIIFILSRSICCRIAKHWSAEKKNDTSPTTTFFIIVVIALLMAAPALRRLGQTLENMRDHSTRHPLCAFRVVQHHGIGIPRPTGSAATQSRLHGLGLQQSVKQQLNRFQNNHILPNSNDGKTTHPRPPADILIIVIESLQLNVISKDNMPHTTEFASQSLQLQNHFSGGNGTNLGFFSLITGKEATWFSQSKHVPAAMNQFFREAGYDVGLFSAVNDFDKFGMQTFINENEYSTFMTEASNWLATDQRAIERATAFLNREVLPISQNRDLARKDDAPIANTPRLAVLHTYSTHGPFDSFPEDELFQPAATQSYVTPFTQEGRQYVWNRYRNSLRSVDRLISPLLDKNRITVIVGDHGEAFLEDGTIGHGVRLDTIQNQTPAVIHVPGRDPKTIKHPTSHVDILPTILAAANLKVEQPKLLDGIDLYDATEESLRNRTFASYHFLGPELMLVGPWTQDPKTPFAYRCAFSLQDWQAAPLNPITRLGLQWKTDEQEAVEADRMKKHFSDWMLSRFGVDPTADPRSTLELFSEHLTSPYCEVRLSAIRIADDVAEPSPQLIKMISRLAADKDKRVSDAAKKTWVNLQRRADY